MFFEKYQRRRASDQILTTSWTRLRGRSSSESGYRPQENAGLSAAENRSPESQALRWIQIPNWNLPRSNLPASVYGNTHSHSRHWQAIDPSRIHGRVYYQSLDCHRPIRVGQPGRASLGVGSGYQRAGRTLSFGQDKTASRESRTNDPAKNAKALTTGIGVSLNREIE